MIRFFRGETLVGTVDFCEPQLNVLAHAQSIEVETGSRCGGHGVCGGDRVRVKKVLSPQAGGMPELFSPLNEKERGHLSPAEISNDVRLACQLFPNRSDLQFDVELLG